MNYTPQLLWSSARFPRVCKHQGDFFKEIFLVGQEASEPLSACVFFFSLVWAPCLMWPENG